MHHIILNSRVVIAEYPVGTFKNATDAVTQAANDLYQFGNINRYNFIPTSKAEAVILYLDSDVQEYAEKQTVGTSFDKYANGLLWDRNKKQEDLYVPHKDEEDIEREQMFEQESQKARADEEAESALPPVSENDKRFKNIDDTEYFQRLQDINTQSPEYLQYLKSIGYEGPAPEPTKVDDTGLERSEEEMAGETSDISEIKKEKDAVLTRVYYMIKDDLDIEFDDEELELLHNSDKVPPELKERRNYVIDTVLESYDVSRPDLIRFMKEHKLPITFTKDLDPDVITSESIKEPMSTSKEESTKKEEPTISTDNTEYEKLYDAFVPKIKASRDKWEATGKLIPDASIEAALHKSIPDANKYEGFINFLKNSDNYNNIFGHVLYSKEDASKFEQFSNALINKMNDYRNKNINISADQVNKAIEKNMGDKLKGFMAYIKDTGKDKQLFSK